VHAAYVRACVRACVRAVVNPLGLGGRSAECTEGDRYELRPLVRAPSDRPRADLQPLGHPLRLLASSVTFASPSSTPNPPADRRATPTRSLGDFRHDLAPCRIFY